MEHEGDPNISPPLGASAAATAAQQSLSSNGAPPANARTAFIDSAVYPGGSRDLSSIALHALCLGMALAGGFLGTLYLASSGYRIWRLTEFTATLALFHFLEFYTTARWNTAKVSVSSYILSANGVAYNAAHAAAMFEIIVTSFFFPGFQDRFSNALTLVLGLVMVISGQTVRSVAMAQAGVSFNHIPARSKKNDHVLVTWGVYSWFRHPSYFGYFIFAVGTQLVVGNKICSLLYFVILWFFFRDRIICMFLSCNSPDNPQTLLLTVL